MDVEERCRRVERRAARISWTAGDGAEAAVRRGLPAIAPGRPAQKWHLLRATRRCQLKIITLKSQCFSRKKIALMGFARNERIPPFDKKTVGISVAYSGVRMEITPRIANPSGTRMAMRVGNQVLDGNASASLTRASSRSGASHSRRAGLTPPPRPPGSPYAPRLATTSPQHPRSL